jgi:hypothetical protein
MAYLLPIKIFVTVAMVLGLLIVAERVSTRVAGVLSGYPMGTAIALFFIGVEMGPQFAAESAVFALAGLTASLVFAYVYFRVSARSRGRGAAPASSAALAAYFATSWALQWLPFTLATAILLTGAVIVLFSFLFHNIRNVAITHSVHLTTTVLLLRACLSAGIILGITAAARIVGPAWAGLFSAFPTVLFPLMLIVHLTHDKDHVHTIIKNFPLGLWSLIIYGCVVALGYPRMGVGWGTAVAFSAATIYLLGFQALMLRRRR